MKDIFIAIITSSAATILAVIAYLKFKKENKSEEKTFDEAELNKYKLEVDKLRKEVTLLTASYIPSPAPEWRKNNYRQYEYVSPSYEIEILFPLGLTFDEIRGKTDEQIFTAYPKFVEMIKSIDDEAQLSPNKIAVRRGVNFPKSKIGKVVIKEIGQSIEGKGFYIGTCYPDSLFA